MSCFGQLQAAHSSWKIQRAGGTCSRPPRLSSRNSRQNSRATCAVGRAQQLGQGAELPPCDLAPARSGLPRPAQHSRLLPSGQRLQAHQAEPFVLPYRCMKPAWNSANFWETTAMSASGGRMVVRTWKVPGACRAEGRGRRNCWRTAGGGGGRLGGARQVLNCNRAAANACHDTQLN